MRLHLNSVTQGPLVGTIDFFGTGTHKDWKGEVSLQALGWGHRLVKAVTHPVVLSPFCDRVLSIISRMQHLPFS